MDVFVTFVTQSIQYPVYIIVYHVPVLCLLQHTDVSGITVFDRLDPSLCKVIVVSFQLIDQSLPQHRFEPGAECHHGRAVQLLLKAGIELPAVFFHRGTAVAVETVCESPDRYVVDHCSHALVTSILNSAGWELHDGNLP